MANNIPIQITGDTTLQQNVDQAKQIEQSISSAYENWQKLGKNSTTDKNLDDTLQSLKNLSDESDKYSKVIAEQTKEQKKQIATLNAYQKAVDSATQAEKESEDELVKLNAQLEKVRAEQKLLTSENKKSTEQYVKNKTRIKELTKEYNQLDKERAKNKESLKTINRLEEKENLTLQEQKQLFAALNVQYNKLVTSQGKASKETLEFQKRLDGLNTEIKDGEKAVGLNQREVGNYGIALDDVKGSVANLAKKVPGLAVAAAVFAGITKAVQALNEEIEKTVKLQNQIAAVFKVSGDELDQYTARTNALISTYDDLNQEDLILSLNAVTKEFGITANEAFDLIEQGIAGGSNVSGEFLSILREYPTQLKAIGLNAEESFKFINATVTEGIYADKGVDAVKEALLKLREMTPASKEALIALGFTSEEIQRKINDGSIASFDFLQQVSQKMVENGEQAQVTGQAFADIFGGAGEDAGFRFIELLSDENILLGDVESTQSQLTTSQLEYAKSLETLKLQLTGANNSLTKFKIANLEVKKALTDNTNSFIGAFERSEDFQKSIKNFTDIFKRLGEILGLNEAKLVGNTKEFKLLSEVLDFFGRQFEFLTGPLEKFISYLEIVKEQITVTKDEAGAFSKITEDVQEKIETLNDWIDEIGERFRELTEFLIPAKNALGDVFNPIIEQGENLLKILGFIQLEAKKVGVDLGGAKADFTRNTPRNYRQKPTPEVEDVVGGSVMGNIIEEDVQEKIETLNDWIDEIGERFRELTEFLIPAKNALGDVFNPIIEQGENLLKILGFIQLEAKKVGVDLGGAKADFTRNTPRNYRQKPTPEVEDVVGGSVMGNIIEEDDIEKIEEYTEYVSELGEKTFDFSLTVLDADKSLIKYQNTVSRAEKLTPEEFLRQFFGFDQETWDGFKDSLVELGFSFLDFQASKLDAEQIALDEKLSLIDQEIAAEREKQDELNAILKEENEKRNENLENDALLTESQIRLSELQVEAKQRQQDELIKQQEEAATKLKNIQKAQILAQTALDSSSAISSIIKYAFANPLNAINPAFAVGQILFNSAILAANIFKARAAIKQLAKGEVLIDGKGNETSDDIPAMLSKNESVITAKGSKRTPNFLRGLNKDAAKADLLKALQLDLGANILQEHNINVGFDSYELKKQNENLLKQIEETQKNNVYLSRLLNFTENKPDFIPMPNGYKRITRNGETTIIFGAR